jgi:amino acid transporter
VNLLWAGLIIVAVAAVAITAMLLVRRRAPAGSYFEDGDRAAGVFGVLATGFAVLLGFVVFLAFESFDQSRSGAELEAVTVAQQFETAQFLPVAVRGRLSGELICYGRSVVRQEWPQMQRGHGSVINPWGLALFTTLKQADPQTPVEQAAYSKWFDQTSDRESARVDRIHGAEGVIPRAVWIALFFMGAVILVFLMFFADSGEARVVQAVQIGSVVAVIAASLFVIGFLSRPYQSTGGGLKPTAMTRTLVTIQQASRALPGLGAPPCDADGKAQPA